VNISGLVVHRERSVELATDQFDGTVLYQLYIVANLLLDKDGYYISDAIALRLLGEDHFFGSSEVERDRFAPRSLTPQHSINFMKGMLRIAAYVQATRQVPIYKPILADIAVYAFPFLDTHSRNKRVFWSYARELGRLGFGRYPMFWAYVVLLTLFDQAILRRGIELVKRLYKRTPRLGASYEGIPVSLMKEEKLNFY
jgi:hypothetical protein